MLKSLEHDFLDVNTAFIAGENENSMFLERKFIDFGLETFRIYIYTGMLAQKHT